MSEPTKKSLVETYVETVDRLTRFEREQLDDDGEYLEDDDDDYEEDDDE